MRMEGEDVQSGLDISRTDVIQPRRDAHPKRLASSDYALVNTQLICIQETH